MKLIQIDPQTLTMEQLQNLKQMNPLINNDYTTIIYELREGEELKAIAVIKDYQNTISSLKEFKMHIKSDESIENFAKECRDLIIENFKQKPDIKELRVLSPTALATQILPKLGFTIVEEENHICYRIMNPAFQNKYDMLYQMIRENFEEQTILKYCEADEYMINIARKSIIVANYRKRLNDNPNLPNIDIKR